MNDERKPDAKAFRELMSKVQLANITIRGQKSLATLQPGLLKGSVDLEPKVVFMYAFEKEALDNHCILRCYPGVDFEVKVKNIGDAVVSASVTYDVVYKFEGPMPEDDVLDFFARKQAFSNALPYMREHLSSLFTKMGFSPFLLPLMKPGQDPGAIPFAEYVAQRRHASAE